MNEGFPVPKNDIPYFPVGSSNRKVYFEHLEWIVLRAKRITDREKAINTILEFNNADIKKESKLKGKS